MTMTPNGVHRAAAAAENQISIGADEGFSLKYRNIYREQNFTAIIWKYIQKYRKENKTQNKCRK